LNEAAPDIRYSLIISDDQLNFSAYDLIAMLLDIEAGSGQNLPTHSIEADTCHWQGHSNPDRLVCGDGDCGECRDAYRDQRSDEISAHMGAPPFRDPTAGHAVRDLVHTG
jgi:hypothetical protein